MCVAKRLKPGTGCLCYTYLFRYLKMFDSSNSLFHLFEFSSSILTNPAVVSTQFTQFYP